MAFLHNISISFRSTVDASGMLLLDTQIVVRFKVMNTVLGAVFHVWVLLQVAGLCRELLVVCV